MSEWNTKVTPWTMRWSPVLIEMCTGQARRSSEMGANSGHGGDFLGGTKKNRRGIKAGVGAAGKALRASERACAKAWRQEETGNGSSGLGRVIETGACKPQAEQPRLSPGVRGLQVWGRW